MSVFEAMAHTESFKAQPLTPLEMAQETALNCFEEADKDHNGTLTFEEFKEWFQSEDEAQESTVVPANDNNEDDDSDARSLFDRFDNNQDGVLDFKEVRS